MKDEFYKSEIAHTTILSDTAFIQIKTVGDSSVLSFGNSRTEVVNTLLSSKECTHEEFYGALKGAEKWVDLVKSLLCSYPRYVALKMVCSIENPSIKQPA